MELEATDKDENRVGVVRFRIYCRVYVNEGIKKKEPYLEAIELGSRVYFWVGQAKMSVENSKTVLTPTFYYTLAYCSSKIASKTSKGLEPFWPTQSTLLYAPPDGSLSFSFYEKPVAGDHKLVTTAGSDAALFLESNFIGKERF